MSVGDLVAAGDRVDRELGKLVTAVIRERGVPHSIDEAYEMAKELHPPVNLLRKRMYKTALLDVADRTAAAGLEVSPAKIDDYPVAAVYQAIISAAGLSPSYRNSAVLSVYDEKSRSLVDRRVSPQVVDAFDERMGQIMMDRLQARLGRHVRAAQRNLLANTMEKGIARVQGSHKPVEVGYARVLTGRESCPFCAMLASRGPVYNKDTALRRKDGLAYHDGCDCVAVLVFRGVPWEGQEQYERLAAEWERAHRESAAAASVGGGVRSAYTLERFKTNLANSGLVQEVGLGANDESGAAPPKLGDASRKGSKRTMKSALTGANPKDDDANCVRCVNAWALRRLGYDVAAAPGQPGISAEQSTLEWVNSKGEHPAWVSGEGEQGGLKWAEVAAQMKQQPDGSYGFIRMKYEDSGTHVVAWERISGKLFVGDPQRPSHDLGADLEAAVPGTIRWVSLQGFRPRKSILGLIGGS